MIIFEDILGLYKNSNIALLIITCLNMKQAKARGKKGKEAAKAVISVLSQ